LVLDSFVAIVDGFSDNIISTTSNIERKL